MAVYVKNADLIREVVESKKNGKLTASAVEMFIKIATESSKKLKYKDPMDREDCIASAIEDLLKYWKNFDPQRMYDIGKVPNAFAYFSQIAKNGMAKGWKKLHHPDAGQMLSISHDGVYNI
jgi:hypothetical protein